MAKKQNSYNKKIDDILDIVIFIKDHAAMQESVDKSINGLKANVKGLRTDVDELKREVNKIKSQMVTKDYLDEKMADMRGDLVVLMRQEDAKVKLLVEILQQKKVITAVDAGKIFKMQPFAQSV